MLRRHGVHKDCARHPRGVNVENGFKGPFSAALRTRGKRTNAEHRISNIQHRTPNGQYCFPPLPLFACPHSVALPRADDRCGLCALERPAAPDAERSSTPGNTGLHGLLSRSVSVLGLSDPSHDLTAGSPHQGRCVAEFHSGAPSFLLPSRAPATGRQGTARSGAGRIIAAHLSPSRP